MRNPVVCRGLTELRKVVNALVREYGKPQLIRVELARDLKRSGKQREEIWKQNRENEKSRETARRKIAETMGGEADDVGDFDVLKVRLAQECNWECPYTGKSIAMEALVGRQAQFDVEHVIPFSRSLDNSFANKTLCYHAENRDHKQNRTPHEAYSSQPERWQEIIGRVKRFRGAAAHSKLRKFQQNGLDEDFAARMLQDTRYMSRLATEYLGILYGGAIDIGGNRRLQVGTGRITAYLRDEWKLNAILDDGDGDEKNRGDHRHHAVDAVVIALTDSGTVARLSGSAALAEQRGNRLFVPIGAPWPTFGDDARQAIDAVNISYRINRRVTGALHQETLYSKPQPHRDKDGKSVEYRHVRKPLQNMSVEEIASIVDPSVRELVQAKLDQIGDEPKKVFSDPGNHPYLAAGDGRKIFIHKARIRKAISVIPLGKASAARYAAPGSNHHMEIVATLDEQGNEKRWEALTVNLMDAAERVRKGTPVVRRDHGPGKRFKFSLAGGEYVEMENEARERFIYRVTVISGNQIEFRLQTDARPIAILKKTKGARVRCSPGALLKAKARKVVVDPLGNILPAND